MTSRPHPQQIFLTFILAVVVPIAAGAATPPCRPCAGVRVADPQSILSSLAQEPKLEGEARLYVAWSVELDGSADPADFEAVRAQGGTPWLIARFRTPAPVTEHIEQLEAELEDLTRLARGAGERAHIQIAWESDGTATDFAFLLKRAAVAVTGSRADARVIAGPLTADVDALRALYAEEIAAYADGIALAPAPRERLEKAIAVLRELDPGKPTVLDALAWPEQGARTLARAAEYATVGFAVTFFDLADPASDLAPLKLLAREFQGDLSYDPATVPRGAQHAWTFVRGEDLGLRVIAEASPGAEQVELFFDDPHLRSPATIDLATGEEGSIFTQRRTERGLVLPLEDPGPVVMLRLVRMSAAELAGLEERVEVEDERQMPVEEILRRLQAFEDDQARRLTHYQARNTLHLRFQSGPAGIEAAYEGPFFFRRGEGFDWVWETFYVDGVRWRSEKIPEIPLIQPEKAAALPLEINFSKEYSYRLRGTADVEGRDCWVIDFKPVTATPGRGLYQGTVWVDRQIYARVRTRALQLGLEGDVISNEETVTFSPINAVGQPAAWEPESFFLPLEIVGQQLLSVLNATIPVETETVLRDVRINGADFDADRETAWASERTMVRDTDEGMKYLIKDDDGKRIVQEEPNTSRTFVVGGVFWDESADFPIPLAGINYLALDWRGTGNQLNFFFAGPLLTINLAEPRLFGSKWDAGFNAFGFLIPTGDELYRDGREAPEEEIESTTGSVAAFLGRPLGNFTKLDFTYRATFNNFSDADDTAPEFVLPEDTLTHTFQTELQYKRGGYRFELQGSYSSRSDWEFWGLPDNTEFSPDQEEYLRWQASFAKTWWFSKFRNFGIELEHLNGSDLDRFSRYDFGIFGDSSVSGYQSGLVRADEASGVHIETGVNAGNLFRFEIEGDAVWATSEETGLDNELLAGIGLEGTLTLPWNLLTNFEIGYALDGPGEGDVAARIVFLKLFPEKWKLWGKKKNKQKESE
ncbi:MAG: hypothetical protein GY719_10620 [bacterium]|nr:hypothetical protein [bacterium]